MVFQLFAILGFTIIAVQDIKKRMVQWMLFPLVGVFLALAHCQNSTPETFLIFSLSNVFLVSAILFILWLYTRFITGKRFLNSSFGLGDLLFFYAFALGFPTITFVVLLAFSLCFSLLAHVVLRFFSNKETVPLAGYMSLFLITIFMLFFSNSFQLYLL